MNCAFATILFITTGCEKSNEKPIIEVPSAKVGMIGYGSLLSREAVEETLGRTYTDSIYTVHVSGYERAWNFAGSTNDPKLPEELLKLDSFYVQGNDTIPFDNIVFLNIEPKPESKINAVLYFLTPKELEKFDTMELGYERIDVTDSIVEYTINGGKVYAYKAMPEYTLNGIGKGKKNIIDQLYYDLVLNANKGNGAEFRKEFEASTLPPDTILVAPVRYKEQVEQ
ncbi:hypothetical protein ATE92_2462 [Ulvibacter sp. MAR_2010_11]|uniref:hypothetical protein n=1 Tax=Ulvibacter sp. MAR_2010_11 TaxID=1250229 RepID=UPI000CCA6D43|nr:hypothetical protein [Ulvibacter sp. MAR_2010_11]PKA84281.1 hypothetical protein ATE92_2462 [Ulvibacter sp. MAR_2010_11]